MKNVLILLILSLCLTTSAQNQLKGKDLINRLENIESEFENGNIEKAIILFYDKEYVINPDKIKKNDLELYDKVKQQVIRGSNTLEINRKNIEQWNILYKNSEYEKILSQYVKLNKNELYQSDYDNYSKIEEFITKWEYTYNDFRTSFTIQYKTLVNTNYYSSAQYTEALKTKDKISNALTLMDNAEFPTGKTPNLLADFNNTKNSLLKKQIEIENFIKENKPLTQNEFNIKLESGNSSISEIIKYANSIELGYLSIKNVSVKYPDGIRKNIEFSKLLSILQLDVVSYFELEEKYDSELKVYNYKQTNDYKYNYNELLEIKNYILNSYFYISIDKSCYQKFDLKSKTFEFTTSNTKDFFYSNKYLQFNRLCLSKPQILTYNESIIFGGTNYFYEQNYYIPVSNNNIALRIEENCKDVSLLFLFKLQKAETSNKVDDFNYDYVVSKVNRIIFYNKKSNEIYINLKNN